MAADQGRNGAPAATVRLERSSRGGPTRDTGAGRWAAGSDSWVRTGPPLGRGPAAGAAAGKQYLWDRGTWRPSCLQRSGGARPRPSTVAPVLAPAPRCGAPRRPAPQPHPPCPPRPPPPPPWCLGPRAARTGPPGPPRAARPGGAGPGRPAHKPLCRRSSRGPACGLRQRAAGPDLALPHPCACG